MKFEKYHVMVAMVFTALATAACAMFEGRQIDVAQHWIEIALGGAALVGVGGGAALAVIKKRKGGS